MTKKSAPTMKDVAKEAGVALGTVSKVINGLSVGEPYKSKVEEAIEKLNYQVNTYARGLKTAKTKTLTLIIPSLTLPFYASFAYEVEQQTYKRGRKLILCCSDTIPQKEMDYITLAAQNKTDGIIALTYSDISDLVPDHIPLIAFDRQFENRSIPRIASDNFEGGRLAVKKLCEFGCKKPAFIGLHSSFSGEADKRFDGYLDICAQYHIDPVYLYAPDTEVPYDAISVFIREHQNKETGQLDFDGIFANTDYHACIAIRILKEMGYSVPEDIQVIGFDGTKKFYPPEEYMVSTILQPLPDLAKKCVTMLLDADSDPLPTLTLLPVSYEYGGTTLDPAYCREAKPTLQASSV
ncbi:MAG: LacI family DNA-binding transcriptional regulator [Clostridiales bacterium]|nr:LacI family DNA-binding transcriptional regulator [Clostridiales bacterium]